MIGWESWSTEEKIRIWPTHKIYWDFEIQTNNLIPPRRPDFVLINLFVIINLFELINLFMLINKKKKN